MSAPRKPADPLQTLLHEAESELSRRLHEACEAEARGISTESAAEIRRLEDSLLSAAMAAEQVITARRHMRQESPTEAGPDSASSPEATGRAPAQPSGENAERGSCQPTDTPLSTAVREFSDVAGRNWRAWPVTPGVSSTRETRRRTLGDFEDGWICFEALDNSGRRRLPRREPRWSDLPPEELQRLLAEAIDARERTPRQPATPPASRDS